MSRGIQMTQFFVTSQSRLAAAHQRPRLVIMTARMLYIAFHKGVDGMNVLVNSLHAKIPQSQVYENLVGRLLGLGDCLVQVSGLGKEKGGFRPFVQINDTLAFILRQKAVLKSVPEVVLYPSDHADL